jgi:hypothetical protein
MTEPYTSSLGRGTAADGDDGTERPRDMPNDQIAPSGAMEGGGAYNRHASLPARGGAFAMPHLENAARLVPLETAGGPIVIADYGSSQGRNSLAPMRAAITALRARVGSQRPILVYHEDLPVNDFNTLFETLANDPQSYASDLPNVFPCAIGRSFYEQVLPPDHVHLGWCSYAAMWMSRIPAQIPGHFFALASTGEARAAFLEQGARDWERFLSLRAAELKPGGRLIAVFPGADDDGTSAFHDIMDRANATLADMVDEGTIKASEREKMALGVCPRRPRDLLEPFARDRVFRGLTVQHCETNTLADAAWADFERDGDKDALAAKHALFFRTIFAPTLAGALERNDTVERRLAFHTRLESGLRRRLADRPQPIHSRVETIVLAKSDEATTSGDSKGDIGALTGAPLGRGASRGRSER